MRCPACRQPLIPHRTGSVTLDVCHHCGGLWLDHGELEKINHEQPDPDVLIAEFFTAPTVHVPEKPQRPCPRCSATTLAQKLYSLGSGVIMDTCPDCDGLWLDHGELEKIREALRHVTPTPLLHQIKILHQPTRKKRNSV